MDDPGVDAQPTGDLEAIRVLMAYAEADGDISAHLDDTTIAKLANEVCENYDRDKDSREEWEDVADKALRDMAKCDYEAKDYPWKGASNVHYPLLPYAVMQFNARAYPAIVKGDEAVSVKVVGADNGQPAIVMGPQGPAPAIDPQSGQVIQWQREPGAKAQRAGRVRDYMNYQLFYKMDDWEGETDSLLSQMAAIGCAFRKVWWDGERHNSCFVPALRLVVNNDAKTLAGAPQISEEIEGVYPFQIKRDIRSGKYRDITLDPEEKEARLLIEQQCHYDLDGDDVPEPYIVTVDHKSRQLLRVVPDFGPEQVKLDDRGVVFIDRRTFYVKFEFLPHPEGKFYNPGLAHLLDQYGEVINTIINQMIDANHAATAGGGFIGSGLRIQGQGQSSTLRFRPGEYKTVPVPGDQLRNGIYERTLPQLSPVMFQLLDLILGAARDIASIKDVLSGEASNTGQVGTTLALIEQGLQVFTAIYKRVYRGLKAEFALLFDNIGKYADDKCVQEYMELLDDPAANFQADFNGQDMDIRPISDPSSVTKMQKMARAQFLLGTANVLTAAGGDLKEILRRVYEAADIEDIDKLLPDNPMAGVAQQLELADKQAGVEEKKSAAFKNTAQGQAALAGVQIDAGNLQLDAQRRMIEAFQAGANGVPA